MVKRYRLTVVIVVIVVIVISFIHELRERSGTIAAFGNQVQRGAAKESDPRVRGDDTGSWGKMKCGCECGCGRFCECSKVIDGEAISHPLTNPPHPFLFYGKVSSRRGLPSRKRGAGIGTHTRTAWTVCCSTKPPSATINGLCLSEINYNILIINVLYS